MKIRKRIDVEQLQKELRDAGIAFRALSAWNTDVDGEVDVKDQDESGAPIDPSTAAVAVINAHVATVIEEPDYGADDPPSDYRNQAATAVRNLRDYINLPAAPTAAQRIAWERLVSRILLYLLRYTIAPKASDVPPPPPPQIPLLEVMSLLSSTIPEPVPTSVPEVETPSVKVELPYSPPPPPPLPELEV